MTAFNIEDKTARYEGLAAGLKIYLQKAYAEIVTEARLAIDSIMVEFFARHPTVNSIIWTQYTPSGTDGEPCDFSADYPNLKIWGRNEGEDTTIKLWVEGDECDDEPSEDEDSYVFRGDQTLLTYLDMYSRSDHPIDKAELRTTTAKIEKAGGKDAVATIIEDFEVVAAFVRSVNDEFLEMIYGECVLVTYSKDGAVIEDYEYESE